MVTIMHFPHLHQVRSLSAVVRLKAMVSSTQIALDDEKPSSSASTTSIKEVSYEDVSMILRTCPRSYMIILVTDGMIWSFSPTTNRI